jgi:hypothetical protein
MDKLFMQFQEAYFTFHANRIDCLRAERQQFASRKGQIFLFATTSKLPTQPHIQQLLEALSPKVRRPVREEYHSLLSSTEVKKMPSFTSIPPIHLHGITPTPTH